MTPIENLHAGEYVAVSEYHCSKSGPVTFSGLPFQVVAVSPPFVALRAPDGTVNPLDYREWSVTKVSRRYARAIWEASALSVDSEGDVRISPRAKRKLLNRLRRERNKVESVEAHDSRDCPRCGARLQQRLRKDRETGRHYWLTFCPTCGYEHDVVTA